MPGNNPSDAIPLGIRILFGLAALGMLFENAPWKGGTWLGISLGIVGPVAFALLALGDRRSTWFPKLAIGVALLYLALVAIRLTGLAA